MQRMKLGRSGIEVTEVCLGTMTWGTQNTEAEGHAQLDRAMEAGIDFIDTAEMYPTNPVSAETAGETERILGTWLAKSGRRDRLTIATKITGPSKNIREGRGIHPDTVREAVEASLRRLQTDVIDLYQFHWPNRGSYQFRKSWTYDPTEQDTARERAHMDEVSATLGDLVREGKIRAFGLSNETAWGTMRWIEAAERTGGPRVASVQNEYSLLCRYFDTDMAELCHHEDITLLAYSPLAAGLLTGKYQNGQIPENSRMSRTPDLGGRKTARVFQAVDAYHELAHRHGLDPSQMALAWVMRRPVPTIPILGATSLEQLETDLGALDQTLSEEIQKEILDVHKAHPLPY